MAGQVWLARAEIIFRLWFWVKDQNNLHRNRETNMALETRIY